MVIVTYKYTDSDHRKPLQENLKDGYMILLTEEKRCFSRERGFPHLELRELGIMGQGGDAVALPI